MQHSAFSLIELMVVLCLFALVATLAVVQTSFLDKIIVNAEIQKLAQMCYYIRQSAIASQKEKILTFDIKNNTYTCDGYHQKLSTAVGFGVLSGVKGPPGQPIQKIEKAITFPGACIHFYPTGIISSGTVYLIDKKKQCMYALSNAVAQVSYLRLYKYVGAWKMM